MLPSCGDADPFKKSGGMSITHGAHLQSPHGGMLSVPPSSGKPVELFLYPGGGTKPWFKAAASSKNTITFNNLLLGT